MKYADDGLLTLYLQNESPSKDQAANWFGMPDVQHPQCGQGVRADGSRSPEHRFTLLFPASPRARKKFEELYKGRTAVERGKTGLKVLWGADDGNPSGNRRFFALSGIVFIVHAGLAMAPGWEGTLSQTKLTLIARTLHGKFKPAAAPRQRSRRVSGERQRRLKFAG